MEECETLAYHQLVESRHETLCIDTLTQQSAEAKLAQQEHGELVCSQSVLV